MFADLGGIFRLAGDQRQRELVIVLDQAGRIDHVGLRDRVQNAGHRHLRLQKLRGVGLDLEFGNLAALQHHHRHAVHAIEPRLDGVVGELPELRLRHGVRGQAVAENRERREGQAIGRQFRGGRQRGLHARQRRVHVLQRLEHVDAPVEEQIDFRRAAAGDGANLLQAGHAVHGLFDGPRDRHLHLIDGRDAVVDADHDAREIGGGEDRHRNRERKIHADGDQREDDENDGPREARGPMLAAERVKRIVDGSLMLLRVVGLLVCRRRRRLRPHLRSWAAGW